MATPHSEKPSFNDESSQQLLPHGAAQSSGSSALPPYRLEAVDRRQSKLAWAGAATAAAVVILTAGIATAFISWILSRRFKTSDAFKESLLVNLPKFTFVVDEGQRNEDDGSSNTTATLRALTISALASQIVAFTNSFVMGLVAYRTAGQWLEDTEFHEHRSGSPSPIQYGLLVSLLGNPSYGSIVRALRYSWRKKLRSSIPRLFIEPLVFAIALYVLTHSVGLGDLWLHSTARSILVPLSHPQPGNASDGVHGFAFNQTLCDTFQTMGPGQPCTHDAEGWAVSDAIRDLKTIGMMVAYNSSEAPYNVVSLTDAGFMAILTPNITPLSTASLTGTDGTAFTFTTLGARASCTYLNDQCIQNTSPAGAFLLNCSSAGWPTLPANTTQDDRTTSGLAPGSGGASETRLFSVRNGSIGILHSNYDASYQQFPNNTWSTNPAVVGMQLATPLVGTLANLNGDNKILADPHGLTEMGCQLEFFNVTASYNPIINQYSIRDATPSNEYFTSVLLEPLISQMANQRLVSDAQSAIFVGNNIILNAIVSQDLGRQAVAWPAAMFNRVAATNTAVIEVRALGAYPMAPVIFVTSLLYLYSLLALSVFFTSRTYTSYNISIVSSQAQPNKMAAVALAQKWLTNPLPLIAQTFPENDGWDGKRSVASTSVRMVNDTHGDRLLLGLYPNRNGETTFGLRKRGVGTEMRRRADSF